ncbi:hypothetical protein PDE_03934 [Penicillium oxalicum 114-2]|uniref:Uncharacterized protein n=1 Tax=Penicillium oxalicum (strain 114-2 / CGMCC 5302) TaxID=933388 RepID=S8ASE7_PENO1|nr:hypothetical protein PDE_03934 [Penicillium oxalicum 114-2]
MQIRRICFLFFSQAAFAVPTTHEGCGNNAPCTGTNQCTTAILVNPTATTTVTTCVPAPTCLNVYAECILPGNIIGNCCSGYCAAHKCRSTDQKWPFCQEDNGPCLTDENCCYSWKNKCVRGICTRPLSEGSSTATATSSPTSYISVD